MRALLVLGMVSGCSYSMMRQQPSREALATSESACERTAPIIGDMVVGAAAVGTGFGLAFTGGDNDDGAMMTGGVIAIGVGVAFLLSGRYGMQQRGECFKQQLAAMQAAQPLHVDAAEPIAGRTCEQRRLDMYSQAVTGADPQQRARLLLQLPICAESPTRERAWALTKTAAINAGMGRCDDIETIAREVYKLDVTLHDVVLLGDIEIKYCLQQRTEL